MRDLRPLVPGADRSPPPAPIDGAVRIALLLTVAAGLGWGVPRALSVGSGPPLVAAFVVVATIAAWFLVGVPGDRASGRFALLAVPGPARLLLEAALVGLAAAAIWKGGSRAAAETLLTVAALHHALTWERVAWLLGRRSGSGGGGNDRDRAATHG